jgi:hypothetical protein
MGTHRTRSSAGPVPASTPSADPDLNPARVLSAIALASIAAGTIHIAPAATLGSDSAQNLAFFAVVAKAQIAWGAVALARAPRWWLALGAVGNLIVLATWVVSRTVGLPVGEFAGVTLPVGFPDGLAAVLEAVIVLGAVALLVQGGVRRGPRRGPRLVPRASPSRLGRRAGRRRRALAGWREQLVGRARSERRRGRSGRPQRSGRRWLI